MILVGRWLHATRTFISTLILGLFSSEFIFRESDEIICFILFEASFFFFYIFTSFNFILNFKSSNLLGYKTKRKSVFGKKKYMCIMYMQHQIIIFNNASSKNLFQNRKFKFNCLVLPQPQSTAVIFSLPVAIIINSRF